MFNPQSTYRLQFHKDFTFKDLERLLPYLKKLGIKTIYASPVFRAVPGSMHGYDAVNPNQVNPEIGTTEQLKELSAMLHKEGMCWLQDIVPNHMAYHYDNNWLMDVLEKGKESHYASFFDIRWNENSSGKILAPFLGSTLEEALNKGEIQLASKDQKLVLKYFDTYFPLNETACNFIKSQQVSITEAISFINADKTILKKIVDEQFYSLIDWKETDTHINYRRFFTVNGLISLNVQDQKVFEQTHQNILCCVKEGVFDGLRVDHIDGLYDPSAYLQALREKSGDDIYIVVEKILKNKEALPHWPIQGSTGYDFLALVNNLFTNKKNEIFFTEFYHKILGNTNTLEEQLSSKKKFILEQHMAGDLDNLCQFFVESKLATDKEMQEISTAGLKNMIAQLLIHCPVYRFYPEKFPLSEEEETQLETILNKIKLEKENYAAVDLLELIFFQKPTWQNEAYCERILHFYRRCMQFTGPLMAKGMEDTLMYTYNRFIGHNEVGDSPELFGIGQAEFHEIMLHRQEHWPLAINATSTHDTKRGEDARARLNVLTDLPEEWIAQVKEWQHLNAKVKKKNAPDLNDEYFIYQTLVATFPMDGDNNEEYRDRLLEYIPKFLREAKVHSTWSEPNEEYEKNVKEFVTIILEKKSAFLEFFIKFYEKIKTAGIINSLSQLILKYTLPGIPDSYQGTELWDLSLVDPDNRRPVDYECRKNFLEEYLAAKNNNDLLQKIWNERDNGKIKLGLTYELLHLRQRNEKVFTDGFYLPLKITGKYSENIFAFARCYKRTWIVVVVSLHPVLVAGKIFQNKDWKDTVVLLPGEAPSEWRNSFSEIKTTDSTLECSKLFRDMPFAVLESVQKENKRSSGVLLPVSALPSDFGIGDFDHARNFIDFLRRSSQKYWQLLPLNPTEAENAFSPYSSSSGMAGNPLYISLQSLVNDNLLPAEDVLQAKIPVTESVNYAEAKNIKYNLYKKAFTQFIKQQEKRKEFSEFCVKENYWLKDFIFYIILKGKYNSPWFTWPEEYKLRNQQALDKLKDDYSEEYEYICWKQFIFHKQWKELRAYAYKSGVQLFGDLPFYLSHDSADVWANPEFFSLNEEGQINKTAGVPPDYFSKEGQLWGMPTFKWDVLKQQNYKWWITRFKKNLELFDLLRIDHFRALDKFWEVSSSEKNAIRGQWFPGPGEDFFKVVEQELGHLPFVAEDLGDNMETVYRLRDNVNLPGMKVLQYAFGENMSTCVDIPHNYKPECIVYSGTHDNNTTLGWFKNELSKDDLTRLEKYTGNKVTEKNCTEIVLRLAYASVANLVIVTMQDLLELDKEGRLNTPGTNENNWLWRLKEDQLTGTIEEKLREWTIFYNRI